MPAIATGLLVERSAGDYVERLRGRDRAQHVAVEVPDLDHHAVLRLVAGEVEFAMLRAQLVVAAAGRLHLLEPLDRGAARRGVVLRCRNRLEMRLLRLVHGVPLRVRLDRRKCGCVLWPRSRYLDAHPTDPPEDPTKCIAGLP